MIGRLQLCVLAAVLSSVPSRAEPLRQPPVVRRERHLVLPRPNLRPPRARAFIPHLLLPSPYRRFRPAPVPEPTPEIPSGEALLPHGFTLTVPVGAGTTAPAAPLNRFAEVGPALGACWHPAADVAWSAVTVRVAFRSDGSVFGTPLIPFAAAPNASDKAAVTRSLSDALKSCTPLHFSPSLGHAVAGEIFAIRFLNQNETHDDRH